MSSLLNLETHVPKRFLFYSHDGAGLGHTRRHLAIAAALSALAPGARVLLVTSVDEVGQLGLPAGVDTLKLPGWRKVARNQYCARRLDLSVEEMVKLRSRLALEAVRNFAPDLLLVDKHPFGVAGEFTAALKAGRKAGARAVLGLRDILDDSATVRNEWAPGRLAGRVTAHYDRILIYGSKALFNPLTEYRLPDAVAKRTQFCGYVVNAADCHRRSSECPCPEPSEARQPRVVLGTAGGGEDGFELLRTFITASAGAAWKALAVAGPMMPTSELRTLEQLAAASGVVVYPFIPCLPKVLESVDAVVCMGGYNTLVESVSEGVPTVCVPRTMPRTEQLLRAAAFERFGLLRLIRPEELTAENLGQAVRDALGTPRPRLRERAHELLNFDGARRAAACLLEVLGSAAAKPPPRGPRVGDEPVLSARSGASVPAEYPSRSAP